MPDLFLVKGSWVSNFLNNGVLMDLTPALDAYDKKGTYREGIFNASERDGKIYAGPVPAGRHFRCVLEQGPVEGHRV